jgi:hypothetical protein
VLVGYDYERGASVEIPAEWRGWLSADGADSAAPTEAVPAVPASPVT